MHFIEPMVRLLGDRTGAIGRGGIMTRDTLRRLGALAGGLVFSLSLAAGAAQEDRRDLRESFERARLLDESGRVGDAVPLYEEAAAQAGTDRALAAAARLRIGLAYEKLGRPEAAAALAAVAADFPEHPSGAAARARLDAIAAERATAQAPRQLLSSDNFQMTSISRDGRVAAGFHTPDGGSSAIAICDLTTGGITTVVPAIAGVQFSAPAISPDGEQLAYGTMATGPAPRLIELHIVPAAAGATPHVLYSRSGGQTLLPMAWSPDGTAILTGQGSAATPGAPGGLTDTQRAWVTVADATTRVIRTFEPWRVPIEPSVSPDGAWLAYSAFPRPSTAPPVPDKYIYVHDASGFNDNPVVTMAGMNRFPVWTADGSRLLFTNERGGARSLYAVAMQNGRAAGEPVRLLEQSGIPHAISDAGTLILSRDSGAGRFTFVADRDADGLKIVQAFDGTNAAVSPDGRSVAFLRVTSRTSAQSELTTRTIETGAERRYPGVSPVVSVPLQWLPDGSGIVVHEAGVSGAPGRYLRLDVTSGTYSLLFERDTDEFVRTPTSALSPDGRTMYVGIRAKGAGPAWTGIGAVDLASGTTRVLATFPGDGVHALVLPPAFAVSPDGGTLAVLWTAERQPIRTRIALVSTSSGVVQQLGGSYGAGLTPAWTADGRFVLHGYRDDEGPWRLWQIPRLGGDPAFAGLDLSALRSGVGLPAIAAAGAVTLSISRDGRRMTFTTSTRPTHQIWAHENILAR
jgi:Tol biopolymer transport system component